MTEKEAIEILRSMQNPKEDYADIVGAPAFCIGFKFVYPESEDYAIEEAIKALEEIQKYREIGTVEECKAAVEKQKPKKPKDGLKINPVLDEKGAYVDADKTVFLICPICGEMVGTDYMRARFCRECGQLIDWSEENGKRI